MNGMATPRTASNPLLALKTLGQSVWLDYIRRDLIDSGELAALVDRDGLLGLTSNPSIFEKAFSAGAEYKIAIEAAARVNPDPTRVYEAVAIRDVRDAADALGAAYRACAGADGFVSLEVSPYLAHDTAGTLEEARRLWQAVSRPNLMIKVPGTPEGVPAVRQLIAEGINVNVTLLFSRSAYEAVAQAFLDGLRQRVDRGEPVDRIASVASFFVSRIDTAVDALIEKRIATASDAARAELSSLLGKAAIANARLAYETYLGRQASDRWRRLAQLGARPQRLLWASTSTKNPRYRDVLYVEELVGRDTVNTLPPATLEAFRDHGVPRESLGEGTEEARETLAHLSRCGIDLEEVTGRLLVEGVAQFRDAFDRLKAAIETRVRTLGT